MILASVNASECPCKYPDAIQTALNWLRDHDLANMDVGTYEIQGRSLYVNLQESSTKPAEDCFPERHDKYLDIQYIVSGAERMGYVPYTGKEAVMLEAKDHDVTLYKDLDGETFVEVWPGCYCIFFSSDIHRPGCAIGEPAPVRKAVVKILQSLI